MLIGVRQVRRLGRKCAFWGNFSCLLPGYWVGILSRKSTLRCGTLEWQGLMGVDVANDPKFQDDGSMLV